MCVIVAFAFLVLIGISNFAIRVQAGDGDLDSTFNGTGKVTTHFLSDDRAFAVAMQSDGKIIAAGQSLNGSHNDFALVRYNTNGSLDMSFGLGGQVITSVGTSNDFARALAIQSDGKIVVVGYSLNGGNKSDFAVVRYNADGLLDSSFGSGGKVTTQVGNSTGAPRDDEAYAVAIQTDGKIIVAGTAVNNSTYYDFALVRYNTNGLLDTAFGSGGIVTTAVGLYSDDDRAYALALQPDGKIVTVGYGGGSYGDFAVVRYNANGLLDTSFGLGGTGIVTTPIGSYYDRGHALAIQTDGKIVVIGHYTTNSFGEAVAVVRYNTNGSLDATFGSGGKVTTEIGSFSYAYAVAIQIDGKIVAVGYNSAHFAVVRYRTDGSLDTSFGSGGIVTTAIGASDQANAVAIQPDGKIVAVGYASVSVTGNDFAVVRYEGAAATPTPTATPTPSPTPTSTPSPSPSPDKMPLIFIPGNPGSQLDLINPQGSNTNVWTGPGGINTFALLPNLSLDPADSHFGLPFDVRDVVRLLPDGEDSYKLFLDFLVSNDYREYTLATISQRRRPPCVGPSNDRNPTLFVFPYDWRQSITRNVDSSISSNVALLGKYIDCIREIYPGTKVNIVTHSTGGLLARRYLTDHPNDNHVNKLITIAAPWLGAPKTINVMETGDFDLKGSWWARGIDLALVYHRLKGLVRFFPGVHELLPSQKYFELTLLPPYELNNKELSYTQYSNLLNQQFTPSVPASNNRAFHEYMLQDDSTSDPNPSDVSFIHIYGLQKGARTIGKVKDALHFECAGRVCGFTRFDIEFTYGDGTVPLTSSTRRGRGQDLNEASALLFRPPIPLSPNENQTAEHTGLLRNVQVQVAINCFLNAATREDEISCGTRLQQSSFAHSRPNTSHLLSGEDPVLPVYYLNIRGATTIIVSDDAGNSRTLYPMRQTVGNGLPTVETYVLEAANAKIVLPTDRTFTITLRSGSAALGLDLALRGDLTTQAIRYRDLSLPSDVAAMLRITPHEIETLKYDNNGDGVFETAVTPTTSVTGSSAQDTDPPQVSVNSTPGDSSLVAITSEDAGSGVKATYYSLDGTNFQPYNAPFRVNPYQGPIVYSFADDNVANRSALVTYYPSISSNEIDNAVFFIRQHYYDFLNREPDPGGLGYWSNELIGCGADLTCLLRRRVGVSAAFFIELEFQKTGSFVYRSYKGALGRQPNYGEFSTDRPLVVDGPTLEQTKRAFMLAFVQKPEFTQKYASQTTASAFVDALIATIRQSSNVDLIDQRSSLIDKFNTGSNLNESRSLVVRDAIDNIAFTTAEFNPSFVLMQYFGYLRRDPDPGGYQFWLDVLNNRVPGNFQGMVCAFISSAEYQRRFSSLVPHTDRECALLQ